MNILDKYPAMVLESIDIIYHNIEKAAVEAKWLESSITEFLNDDRDGLVKIDPEIKEALINQMEKYSSVARAIRQVVLFPEITNTKKYQDDHKEYKKESK